MRVLVCVKQVGILGDEVEFTHDGRGIDPDYLDFSLNEWDWYATEEALRLRELHGGEVVIATAAGQRAESVLRRCLAMGADRAIRIDLAESVADPIAVAHVLAEAVREEQPDLVLCGVQASDTVEAATGAALAGVLRWPVVTVVMGLTFDPASGAARVRRELEGGLIELVSVSAPAVLTIQTGANEPRYATFRAIKQAEQKPLAVGEPPQSVRAGATISALYVPERSDHAEMLTEDPLEAARLIADIIKQRVG